MATKARFAGLALTFMVIIIGSMPAGGFSTAASSPMVGKLVNNFTDHRDAGR